MNKKETIESNVMGVKFGIYDDESGEFIPLDNGKEFEKRLGINKKFANSFLIFIDNLKYAIHSDMVDIFKKIEDKND